LDEDAGGGEDDRAGEAVVEVEVDSSRLSRTLGKQQRAQSLSSTAISSLSLEGGVTSTNGIDGAADASRSAIVEQNRSWKSSDGCTEGGASPES